MASTTAGVIADATTIATSGEKTEAQIQLTKELGEYVEAPWDIIGSYFRGSHLRQTVRHQLESYNDFVNKQIPRTIEMFNPVRIVNSSL